MFWILWIIKLFNIVKIRSDKKKDIWKNKGILFFFVIIMILFVCMYVYELVSVMELVCIYIYMFLNMYFSWVDMEDKWVLY